MNEISLLITTVKRLLKKKGLTYRAVASALKLSEPSVKRMFASNRMTLERLAQVSELLDFTLAELIQEATSEAQRINTLTVDQETLLVSDIKLLLITVCTLNNWVMSDIVDVYQLTEMECLQRLLILDRLRIIELLPGNRIRLIIARDFDWLVDGPIREFFRTQEQDNFLASSFLEPGESMAFVQGMFTEVAFTKLKPELQRLRKIFSELHEESQSAELSKKNSASMLLATRRGWEPTAFNNLRREII